MVKRKIDNRIRILIENGIALGHRSFFVIVGDRSKDQVIYLHHMLSKSCLKQASILWCYKKELVLSSNKKKRLKQLKARMKAGSTQCNEEDPFELFMSTTEIRYCFYKDTHKILGNTFQMCVLQDFEAMTPNVLCRTIETVEGGGIIVILLQTLTSLRQLFTLSMDVHARYRTEALQHIIPRFNERDLMQVLPISSHLKNIQAVSSANNNLSPRDKELEELKAALAENPPIGMIIGLCKTLDQAKAVLQFIIAITEKTLKATVTLTAGRGRGKSAAIGIALAGAIAFGYSNIYVTSPSPENVATLFEFVLKGLREMKYEEFIHFQILRSSEPNLHKSIIRITVSKGYRQFIQYISPNENACLGNAEIVVIDEAAAIPLPYVKALMGPYLVFLSSTVTGYEGTGRSLSLKLINELRYECNSEIPTSSSRILNEVVLEESIRYKSGDPVEQWLYNILCLEASLVDPYSSIPFPQQCQLFFVNRDTLFGYHEVSEKFLSDIIGLLVSSHYRNSPDDLQTLSDAPAHRLFVLLPSDCTENATVVPPVLCVIQVVLEGKISKSSVASALSLGGERPYGDLIPWTISNLFQNYDFPQLSGARIVRIATHPALQGRGYGSRAVKLLEKYYATVADQADLVETSVKDEAHYNIINEDEVGLLEEKVMPSTTVAPLLLSISERLPEPVHYLGVSFGTTSQLFNFWKKAGFTAVYISQVANSLTGEHTMIMLKTLNECQEFWLKEFWLDFHKRLVFWLGEALRTYNCKFALSLLSNSVFICSKYDPSTTELKLYITKDDLKRIDRFCHNQCEAAFVSDLYPSLARLYFLKKVTLKLRPVQATRIWDKREQCSEQCSSDLKEIQFFGSTVHSLGQEIASKQFADEKMTTNLIKLDNQYKLRSFEEEVNTYAVGGKSVDLIVSDDSKVKMKKKQKS